MTPLTIASRYLLGRKLRTFLTTLAIVFGVFLIFAMNTMIPAMIDAFTANAMSASGQVDMSITHKTNDSFNDNLLGKVARMPGVRMAAGFLKRTVNLPTNYFDHDPSKPDEFSVVSLVGVDNDGLRMHSYQVAEGRFIRASDEDKAVITATLATGLGIGVGDEFKLPTAVGTVTLEVVGIQSARTLPGNEEVIVSLNDAQRLLDQPGLINTIEANLDTSDPAERAQIEAAVTARLGRNYEVGTLSSGDELIGNIAVAQISFSMFGAFALLMGGFIIFNTFRTIVAERRHDIGVLRSLGASRRMITGLILTEGLLQGIVGTVVGMVAGYGLAVLAISALKPLYESFVHLNIDATPPISPALVVVTLLIGLGVTVFSGLLPAISASKVTPMDALRPSSAEVAGGRKLGVGVYIGAGLIVLALAALLTANIGLTALGVLMLIAGLILISPALLDPIARAFGALIAVAFARDGTGTIAQANLSRNPSRAAITASATMIGLALIVAMIGVSNSVEVGFINVLRNSLGSDYLLVPPALSLWENNVGAKPEFADRLKHVRGVEAVSTLRVASSEVKGDALTILGVDPANFNQVSTLSYTAGDPANSVDQLNAGRFVILNGILATQLGLTVGDEVRFTTPRGTATYQVVAVAGDYLNAKLPTAYISQKSMQKDFNKTEDVFIQINLDPNADPAAVEASFAKIMEDYPQFKLINGREFFEENKVLLQQSFVGLQVLMGVLAVPSLIAMVNTLAIAVIERTREIGMLRATGATRRQISTTIVAEAMLLASVGTVLGVAAGLYLGYVLVSAMAFAGYPSSFFFPTTGVIVAIIAGVLFGLIAAIIPSRQAARLEIVKALQYE